MNPNQFVGKRIGNYVIKNIIGQGGFSSVYIAEEILQNNESTKDNKINERRNETNASSAKNCVACKIIPREKFEKQKLTKRLDQEIRVHQMMHHPNVVQLIDIQKDSKFYYIFLEFCPSGELLQIITSSRKISEIEAAIIFKQILIGLQYIHSLNVAHRDLKLENILVGQYGQIKIADFGLSKLLDIKSKGFTNTPCGSAFYVSPECISGLPYDGKKSDIWSCGVILYAITTGSFPWTRKNQFQLFKQIKKGDYKIPYYISDNCSDLIRRLLTVDHNKRITIDEALIHPFLKNISFPSTLQEFKFVSLRKIDRILGFDEDFEYNDMITIIAKETSGSDCKIESNFFKIRKGLSDIKLEDEKKVIN
ncbi:hypothetical protein M9Y10_014039 [Tritrichomonas musculus]|uniref:Protein kinase domain-containing protein n=1 Tax=Tritrichomonas musculus TaxID=1915356 RepID=A0ABR2KZK5_9EUKA